MKLNSVAERSIHIKEDRLELVQGYATRVPFDMVNEMSIETEMQILDHNEFPGRNLTSVNTYFALCLVWVAGLLPPPPLPEEEPAADCCCVLPPPSSLSFSLDLLAIRWRSFLALFLPVLIRSRTSGCSLGGPWCSSDASMMHVMSGFVSAEEDEVEEGEGWRLASISWCFRPLKWLIR